MNGKDERKKQIMLVKQAIVRNSNLYKRMLELQIGAGVEDTEYRKEVANTLTQSIMDFAELLAILPNETCIELLDMFEQTIGMYGAVSKVGMLMSALGFSDNDSAIAMLEAEANARQTVFGEDMEEALNLIHQNMSLVDVSVMVDGSVNVVNVHGIGGSVDENNDGEDGFVQLDMFGDPVDFDPHNN